MRTYNPTSAEDELLLLEWWSALTEGNELLTVFDERYTRLSEFLLAFRADVLLFEVDTQGIWFAGWFDRSPLAGAFFSMWVRKDKRHSKKTLESVSEALGIGFHDLKFTTILVVTKEPVIAKMHQKYGFTRLGVVPGLYFGEPAIVSYMSDDTFDAIAAEEPAKEAAHGG